jgi:hypothetical protein
MVKNKVRAFLFVSVASLLAVGLSLHPRASATVPGVNEITSVSSGGAQGDQNADSNTSISGDGRYVVFASRATNLVSSDTNAKSDIFVRDRASSTTTRISVSSSGTQANDDSSDPRISNDGRYVVFASVASNLVTGDTNSAQDVFIHDMQTGTTVAADTNASGTLSNNNSEWPDISADGRFVVFDSVGSNLVSGINPNGVGAQIFVKDMYVGAIKTLSVDGSGNEGNGASSIPKIDCSGNVVTFYSDASNIVSGDTNGHGDIFVDVLGWSGDQLDNVTQSANNLAEYPAISCNGNVISYASGATNIVSGDANGYWDIFGYNRLTKSNTMISLTSTGAQGNDHSSYPSVSDDGRYVAFQSNATNFSIYPDGWSPSANIFVHDNKTGSTQVITFSQVSTGYLTGDAGTPTISADGSSVAYVYGSNHLISSDTNGYIDIYDSQTGF